MLYKHNTAKNCLELYDGSKPYGCVIIQIPPNSFQLMVYNTLKQTIFSTSLTTDFKYSIRDSFLSLSTDMGEFWTLYFIPTNGSSTDPELVSSFLRFIIATSALTYYLPNVEDSSQQNQMLSTNHNFQIITTGTIANTTASEESKLQLRATAGVYVRVWDISSSSSIFMDYKAVLEAPPTIEIVPPQDVLRVQISPSEDTSSESPRQSLLHDVLSSSLIGRGKGEKYLFSALTGQDISSSPSLAATTGSHLYVLEVTVAKTKKPSGEGRGVGVAQGPSSSISSFAQMPDEKDATTDAPLDAAADAAEGIGTTGESVRLRMARLSRQTGGIQALAMAAVMSGTSSSCHPEKTAIHTGLEPSSVSPSSGTAIALEGRSPMASEKVEDAVMMQPLVPIESVNMEESVNTAPTFVDAVNNPSGPKGITAVSSEHLLDEAARPQRQSSEGREGAVDGGVVLVSLEELRVLVLQVLGEVRTVASSVYSIDSKIDKTLQASGRGDEGGTGEGSGDRQQGVGAVARLRDDVDEKTSDKNVCDSSRNRNGSESLIQAGPQPPLPSRQTNELQRAVFARCEEGSDVHGPNALLMTPVASDKQAWTRNSVGEFDKGNGKGGESSDGPNGEDAVCPESFNPDLHIRRVEAERVIRSLGQSIFQGFCEAFSNDAVTEGGGCTAGGDSLSGVARTFSSDEVISTAGEIVRASIKKYVRL